MELPDETIISHYDMVGGKVKVNMETPDEKTDLIMPPAGFLKVSDKMCLAIKKRDLII